MNAFSDSDCKNFSANIPGINEEICPPNNVGLCVNQAAFEGPWGSVMAMGGFPGDHGDDADEK